MSFLHRIRALAPLAVTVALMGAVAVLTDAGPIGADGQPWPTPPPGPRPPAARVVAEADIKRVEVPPVAGAGSAVVLPLSMPLPRFPRVPSANYDWSGGVRLTTDAGSVDRTLQLSFVPVDPDEAPQPPKHQLLRLAFDLRAFDHNAEEITPVLRRPWVLEIPTRGLTRAADDPARLLIVRHEGKDGWVPLTTTYHRSRGVLQARILRVGLFGVVMEPNVVAG